MVLLFSSIFESGQRLSIYSKDVFQEAGQMALGTPVSRTMMLWVPGDPGGRKYSVTQRDAGHRPGNHNGYLIVQSLERGGTTLLPEEKDLPTSMSACVPKPHAAMHMSLRVAAQQAQIHRYSSVFSLHIPHKRSIMAFVAWCHLHYALFLFLSLRRTLSNGQFYLSDILNDYCFY